jgi:hypothetical protein
MNEGSKSRTSENHESTAATNASEVIVEAPEPPFQ